MCHFLALAQVPYPCSSQHTTARRLVGLAKESQNGGKGHIRTLESSPVDTRVVNVAERNVSSLPLNVISMKGGEEEARDTNCVSPESEIAYITRVAIECVRLGTRLHILRPSQSD